ncbi:hypothetical protein CesoFtcFv8_016037 [Champsocephalus esox]|uniref:Uncharacterized protein n=1 Tax=Champsocephalus esox TaxID=159716 RepID=A0AAN8GPV8_9TELE|nr:hypothetical protein CesoFtcFv8_016037 [Champsocephalus esox]
MSAFTRPLFAMSAPTAAAPSSQLQKTTSLFGPSSAFNPTADPLLPLAPSPVPSLPLAPPSSLPPVLAPRRLPPPSLGKLTKSWVTFDDDLDFQHPTKTPQAPVFPSSSLVGQTQTLPSRSVFDSEPDWLSSVPSVFPTLPPPIPTRTVPSNPNLPEGVSDDCMFPTESWDHS